MFVADKPKALHKILISTSSNIDRIIGPIINATQDLDVITRKQIKEIKFEYLGSMGQWVELNLK